MREGHHSENGWEAVEDMPTRAPVNLNWMVSFSDLMAIMLSFFVMMFSMSSIQTQAWHSIVNGLSNELAPGRERSLIETENDARPIRLMEPKGIDLGYLEAVLREKFRNDMILSHARIAGQGDRVSIALPVDMLFQIESARLAPSAPVMLQAVGRSLASIKNRVEVHVYVAQENREALSPEGLHASAWDLATDRAVSVSTLLIRGGVSTTVIPVGHATGGVGAGGANDLVELVIREMDSK